MRASSPAVVLPAAPAGFAVLAINLTYRMGTDPKQCRQRALWCTDLAERATEPTLKAVLTDLAERWQKAAVELECADKVGQGGNHPFSGS